jgi:hypothetical protein
LSHARATANAAPPTVRSKSSDAALALLAVGLAVATTAHYENASTNAPINIHTFMVFSAVIR